MVCEMIFDSLTHCLPQIDMDPEGRENPSPFILSPCEGERVGMRSRFHLSVFHLWQSVAFGGLFLLGF